MSNKKKKVFVMLSGGVDSSVAAALLKNAGFDVVGCHIKCFNVDGCGAKDAADARRVAEKLAISFYIFDLEKEYKERVVRYMVDGYKKGETPNPDVMCNQEIKFGLFFKKALALGADFVATGHYTKLVKTQNYALAAARDKEKDQSYFLWTLTGERLRRCLFPLGDLTKAETRKLAEKYGLPTARKKDSQGICFLGQVSLADFLKNYLPVKRGEVLDSGGKKIGEHQGAYFYTIGQRRGLDLATKNQKLGVKGEPATPAHYVVAKDVSANTIVVAEENDGALARSEVRLTEVNLLKVFKKNNTKVWARIRYRQPLQAAILRLDDGVAALIFAQPQKFVAVGQSAVFYDGAGVLLGGGVIR